MAAPARTNEFKKVPIPHDLADRKINLTDNARTVLQKRYLRRGDDGQPIETEQEMFWRVAYHVALAEKEHGGDDAQVETWARRFFDLLTNLNFFPNSPTFTGAGTPLGQLAACFVLAIEDDMGRSGSGIFETLRHAALIQQTGGGNGFSFSRLRPKGALVKSSSGTATGPVGFLRVYDQAFGEIAQGGCLTSDTLVFTDNGLLRLDELVTHHEAGWREHDITVATDEGPRRSTQAYNNGVAPVLKISTDAGLSLTGTYNHKLKVMTEDGPVWRRFDALQAGDSILVKLGQHKGHLQSLSHPVKQHGNQIMPIMKSVLDEELAFFLGYMSGDGFIASRNDDHRIGVSVAHSSYLYDEMPLIMQSLFGDHITIHRLQKEHDASVTFTIDNRAVKDFMALNGFEKATSTKVRVPRLIRQSPPHIVGAYLRGLFEGAGSRSQEIISFQSTSKQLVDETAVLLMGLGCPVQVAQKTSTNTERDAWTVRVVSDAGLQAWREYIGCDSRSRFADLYQAGFVLDYASTTYNHQPSMVLTDGFALVAEAQPLDMTDDKQWLVTITDVVDAGEALTLDIEVEENHTYLANGLVSHNSRRGANMAVLRVDHPDIRDFIKCKSEEGNIANFNISVGITEKFMQAVADDTDFDLVNPQTNEVWETVRARELFDMIVEYAHHNGEPGVLFLDAANAENPVPHLYELESTNPCFAADTRLYTNEGMVRIGDLFEQEQSTRVVLDSRFGHDETFAFATRPVMTGEKMVYRLQTKAGYYLRATADHRVMTPEGWRPLGELDRGDKIHILNRKGGFGNTGSYELGAVLGWLVGDGTVNKIRAVLSFFGDEKRELAPLFAGYVNKLVAPLTNAPRQYNLAPIGIAERDEARIASKRLRIIAEEHGLTDDKFRVPEQVFLGTEDMQRGFIQALFTADGSFQENAEKGSSVRLASSYIELLEDVQQLLLNFGVASKLYRNRRGAGYHELPDGNGGLKPYWTRDQHELVISKQNMAVFASEIGFLTEDKQGRLENYLANTKRGPYAEYFVTTVESITKEGIEEVFDLTEPVTHSIVANGLVTHNCGEQFLGPFENCCLGSVNLAQHVTDDGRVDWEKLAESVSTATRFLDDVVTSNAYVPAVPELREAAERVRRIGLGIMGLADLMYAVGVRYGSVDGQEFASQVMEFVRYHSMNTSVELAEERGPFLAIEGSRYDPKNLQWTPPQSIIEHTTNWDRPTVDWNVVRNGILKHGIRNGAQTTIAPTGTISTVSGIEGYGCEPVFALAYMRYVNSNAGNDTERFTLQYTSPLFDRALRDAGLSQAEIDAIVEQVNMKGSCQDIAEVPDNVRRVFVTAGDISAEEHVRMQAVMQAHVDNAISKTINFPAGTTQEEVAQAYQLGWELGCKGMTVYVTGSRDVVVLETAETKQKREGTETTEAPAPIKAEDQPLPLFNERKKPRPSVLPGKTYRILTPAGTTYITINENGYGHGHPFEVFVHTAKAGSEIAAVSEAIGRLVSLVLRQASPISPRDRVKEMVRQLEDIGGGRSLGFGPNRVASLPDAVAQVLHAYLTETDDADGAEVLYTALSEAQLPLALEAEVEQQQQVTAIGDICPECGQATLIREEGCLHCYSCGYSEC